MLVFIIGFIFGILFGVGLGVAWGISAWSDYEETKQKDE